MTAASSAQAAPGGLSGAASKRRRLAGGMAVLLLLGLAAGLVAGPAGLSLEAFRVDLRSPQAGLIFGEIRLPRTLGAALVGALLGLSGALSQGLFRNPLADPYLLGAAAGSGLAVVLVLAAASMSLAAPGGFARVGLVSAAFAGALLGVGLTLALARGAAQTTRLLLAGVIVGIVLGSLGDLATVISPEALRGRQAFGLGNTSLIDASALLVLGTGLALLLALARRLARALDALTLGEDSAASLGLDLGRVRLALVAMLAFATALAVSQAGLIAFVGLIAPHLVRRRAPGPHAWLLAASAAMGAVLLLLADVLSRAAIAPRELPVGVVTGVLGGAYLYLLLRRGFEP